MELTPKTQAVELIKQADRILILTHEDPDGDAVGSTLALKAALKKIGKSAQAVFTGRLKDFSYLLGFDEVRNSKLEASNDLIITIDTRNTGEGLNLGYKKLPESRRINIVITPPKGELLPEDVTVERSSPKFDLVIILDTPTTGLLGPIHEEFPSLFYETPTIVIDHHATNAYFGKINWVDLTAASTAEMLVSLIESLSRDEPLIDEAIATCLLTGLITDTGSFQNLNTTPKALTVAAQLVAAGARHQEIIDRVRTKSLTTLKLWGLALSRVAVDETARFVWTEVTEADLKEVNAEAGDDSGLIDELLKTVSEVDFALVLSQRGDFIDGNLRSIAKNLDVSEIARMLGGGGHKAASGFRLSGKLEEKRSEILEKIRTFQAARQATLEAKAAKS